MQLQQRNDVADGARAVKCLIRDLQQLATASPDGITAAPATEDDLLHWDAAIFGPDESCWAGGVFLLKLTFTHEYPSKTAAREVHNALIPPQCISRWERVLGYLAGRQATTWRACWCSSDRYSQTQMQTLRRT